MKKIDKLIERIDSLKLYEGKDKFDIFMFTYGRWFTVLVSPFLFIMCPPPIISTWPLWKLSNSSIFFHLLLFLIIFPSTYLFMAVVCFVDAYKFYKKIKLK